MNPDDLLNQFDDAAIISAIGRAEAHTTSEIRVFISRKSPDDVVERATERFRKLGMHLTAERNAVLIYLAPKCQKFAIIGDERAHAACGQAVWDQAAVLIGERLRNGSFTRAITQTVEFIGKSLADHFPEDGAQRESFPDEVLRD
jgi:uncharacterized membrane protein